MTASALPSRLAVRASPQHAPPWEPLHRPPQRSESQEHAAFDKKMEGLAVLAVNWGCYLCVWDACDAPWLFLMQLVPLMARFMS